MASSPQPPEESEESPELAELVHEQLPARPSRAWGCWPVVVVTVVVVALVAVLFATPATNRDHSHPFAGALPQWTTFRDQLGLYTLQLPAGWTTQVSTDSGSTIGNNTGHATLVTERADLTETTGGAQIDILAEPIRTDFVHRWFCQAWPATSKNGWFQGIPAVYRGPGTWLFETGNAHFQFDVTIPGVMAPLHPGGPDIPLTPVATQTPLQPTQATDGGPGVTYTILDTFQPSDPKPLAC